MMIKTHTRFNKFIPLIIVILLPFFLIAYQNCNVNDISNDSFVLPDRLFRASIPVSKGVLDPSCMTSSNYNACIFLKNPVAQNQASFYPPITFDTDLSSLQTYGVNLVGITDRYLKNLTYNVKIDWQNEGQAVPRVQADANGTWKFEYANDPYHQLAQVMTYYWLMYQMSYMQENAGRWYAENKNIQVYALRTSLENDAYFDYSEESSGTIALGYFTLEGRIAAAMSGDIILHEAAHASFYHSNPHRNTQDSRTHKICYDDSTLCCRSYKGCFKAINEGQADFHSLVIFSSLSSPAHEIPPSVGEGVSNNLERGLGICTNRHIDSIREQTAIAIYNSCGISHELRGEIHIMGNVYAGIWWDIYKNSLTNENEILQLFSDHLPVISGDDTFETVGVKILNLERQKFNGKYANIIRQAFATKGLHLLL